MIEIFSNALLKQQTCFENVLRIWCPFFFITNNVGLAHWFQEHILPSITTNTDFVDGVFFIGKEQKRFKSFIFINEQTVQTPGVRLKSEELLELLRQEGHLSLCITYTLSQINRVLYLLTG